MSFAYKVAQKVENELLIFSPICFPDHPDNPCNYEVEEYPLYMGIHLPETPDKYAIKFTGVTTLLNELTWFNFN